MYAYLTIGIFEYAPISTYISRHNNTYLCLFTSPVLFLLFSVQNGPQYHWGGGGCWVFLHV